MKNAAIATNRSRLLKLLKVIDILSETIFKATITFNSLNIMLRRWWKTVLANCRNLPQVAIT